LLACVALLAAVAGCGGGGGGHDMADNAKVAPGARVIHVDARSFDFSPSTIQVRSGEDVAIELKSEDSFHDFEVEGKGHIVGADGDTTAKGGLRIDKPGRYTFFCSVAGHRASGMEGTLVVR